MKNSNQPIYPTETVNDPYLIKKLQSTTKFNGLTKREYLASLAMQSLISNQEQVGLTPEYILKFIGEPKETNYIYKVHYPIYVAKESLLFADAILNELEK